MYFGEQQYLEGKRIALESIAYFYNCVRFLDEQHFQYKFQMFKNVSRANFINLVV